MAGYVPRRFSCPRAVTNPSSNRAQCRLTTLIEALTTTICHHLVAWRHSGVMFMKKWRLKSLCP